MKKRFLICVAGIFAVVSTILILIQKNDIANAATGEPLGCSYYAEDSRNSIYTLWFVRVDVGKYHIDPNSHETWGLGSYISDCPDDGELFRLNSSGIYCGTNFDFETNPNRETYPRAKVCDKDTRDPGTRMVTREENIGLCYYVDASGNNMKTFAANYDVNEGYFLSDPNSESIIEIEDESIMDQNGCIPMIPISDGTCDTCTDTWYRAGIDPADRLGGQPVKVFVNGTEAKSIAAEIINDTTYISVQGLCTHVSIGCKYGYDGEAGKRAKKLTITLDDRKVTCDFNSNCVLTSGTSTDKAIPQPNSPAIKFIPNTPDQLPMLGTTNLGQVDAMIPLRVVGEGLGKEIIWPESEEPKVYINDAAQKGHIINVPIDARPVSRSNFRTIVEMTGWDYTEIENGVPDMQQQSNGAEVWTPGNPTAVRAATLNAATSNDTSNTVLIVNLSSYFFGGLIGIRDPLAYQSLDGHTSDSATDLDNKLADLKKLISEVKHSTIYVTYAIPRTRPEVRIKELVSKDKAQSDYNSGERIATTYILNGDQPNLDRISSILLHYEAVSVEYMYLYYYTEGTNGIINYDRLPAGIPADIRASIKSRAEKFYNKYQSEIKAYLDMYEKVEHFIRRLKSITNPRNCGHCVLEVGIEDTELPNIFKTLKAQDPNNPLLLLRKSQSGAYLDDTVRFNSADYVMGKLGNDNLITFYGIDEIGHIIFAKELLKMEKNIQLDIQRRGEMSDYGVVDDYDKYSFTDIFNKYKAYMGIPTNNTATSDLRPIQDFIYNQASSVNWPEIYTEKDRAMFMFCDDTKMSRTNALIEQGPTIWQVPNIGCWNTVANYVGISFTRSIAFEVLRHDIEVCMNSTNLGCTKDSLTPQLSQRVNIYDQTRMIGIMEDLVHNDIKLSAEDEQSLGTNISTLTSHPLVDTIKNTDLKIGDYTYRYKNALLDAFYPWQRSFEVTLGVTLGR